jgi:hypothetical protein
VWKVLIKTALDMLLQQHTEIRYIATREMRRGVVKVNLSLPIV